MTFEQMLVEVKRGLWATRQSWCPMNVHHEGLVKAARPQVMKVQEEGGGGPELRYVSGKMVPAWLGGDHAGTSTTYVPDRSELFAEDWQVCVPSAEELLIPLAVQPAAMPETQAAEEGGTVPAVDPGSPGTAAMPPANPEGMAAAAESQAG